MGVVIAFEEAIARIAAEPELHEVEIVMTTVRPVGRTTEFRLMVDRPGGMDIATCGQIASRINSALREESELYTLQVESAGLERPLVREADYERFRGKLICIKTHELLDGAKTHRGRLDGITDGTVRILAETGERSIPYASIKTANLEFDLRAALRHAASDESEHSNPKKTGRERRKT